MLRVKIPKIIISLLIIMIAVFAKMIVLYYLPEKYFIDSMHIQELMGYTKEWIMGNSFNNTAYLFTKINIFNFTSLAQWHLVNGCVFTLLMIYMNKEFKFNSLFDYMFLFMSVGLLNIFTFNLSKELWQFLMFLFVFQIIKKDIYSIDVIIFVSAGILMIWGVLFRVYYILIGAYTILALFLFKVLRVFKGSKKNKSVVMLLLLILGVGVSLLIAQVFLPDEYITIINIHEKINRYRIGSETAKNTIMNIIPTGNSLVRYISNYVINLVRMLFPLELIQEGPFYYIFILYQLMVTCKVFLLIGKLVKNECGKTEKAALMVYIGYLLGSALFEPDFGTWVRHESSTFPVMAGAFFKKSIKKA